MVILLPPSEGKAQPARGRALDLATLGYPSLSDARGVMLDALVAASARDDADARFGVGEGLRDVVARNVHIRSLPTAAAGSIYTGVLYDALDLASLDVAQRRRANRRLVIFSALFGVVRPTDRIPAYRLSADVTLPGVGAVASFWRGELARVLAPPRTGLIVDCRSSTYATMWRPAGAVGVRVLREEAGKRTVVSHMAKHARGLVARALVEHDGEPRTVDELVDVLSAHFARTVVTTATGVRVTVAVEAADGGIDVITEV